MPAHTEGKAHLFFVGQEPCQFLAVSNTGCIAIQTPDNPVRIFHWYFRSKGRELITLPPVKWIAVWSCRAPWNPEPRGEITRLIVKECELTSIDVRDLSRLSHLNCAKNLLERLDCSGMTSLKSLDCSGNDLTFVNVEGCVRLERLRVGGNRKLSQSASELLAQARGEPTIYRRHFLTATSLFNLSDSLPTTQTSMDPTTAYLEMFNSMQEKDYDTARERALGLKEWLGRGGFYPPRYSRVEVDAYLKNVLRRTAHLNREGRTVMARPCKPLLGCGSFSAPAGLRSPTLRDSRNPTA